MGDSRGEKGCLSQSREARKVWSSGHAVRILFGQDLQDEQDLILVDNPVNAVILSNFFLSASSALSAVKSGGRPHSVFVPSW